MRLTELIKKYADNSESPELERWLNEKSSSYENKYFEKIDLWLSQNRLRETDKEGMSYILSIRDQIISKLGHNDSTKDKILIIFIKSIEDAYINPTVRDMVDDDIEELNDLLNDFKPFEYKTTEEKGGRPKGVTKKTIDRYKKVIHQFEILNKKYSSKTKAELYELLATRDYDGKSYKRNTIRNIIEDKKYNLIPSR